MPLDSSIDLAKVYELSSVTPELYRLVSLPLSEL
jgi:hypothetical protein